MRVKEDHTQNVVYLYIYIRLRAVKVSLHITSSLLRSEEILIKSSRGHIVPHPHWPTSILSSKPPTSSFLKVCTLRVEELLAQASQQFLAVVPLAIALPPTVMYSYHRVFRSRYKSLSLFYPVSDIRTLHLFIFLLEIILL